MNFPTFEFSFKNWSCKCFNKQKSIRPDKEGDEKVKKPRFPNILNPPRRLSRVDSTSGEEETTVCIKRSDVGRLVKTKCVQF